MACDSYRALLDTTAWVEEKQEGTLVGF